MPPPPPRDRLSFSSPRVKCQRSCQPSFHLARGRSTNHWFSQSFGIVSFPVFPPSLRSIPKAVHRPCTLDPKNSWVLEKSCESKFRAAPPSLLRLKLGCPFLEN